MNLKKMKPILKPKKAKVKDPPRFPKLIIPIENEVKTQFSRDMNKMLVDVTKKLIEFNK